MQSPAHPLAPMLRKFMKSAMLSDKDQAALLKLPYQLRTIRRGSYLIRDGEKPSHCCVIISGFAFRQKLVGDGGRQILALHMSGDVVDLQNCVLRSADHSLQTLTEVEAALIPTEAMRKLAFERPAIGLAMWVETAVDGSIHREWTANLGRRDARSRIAHLLCEFGMRLRGAELGELCRYELPMTQEEIADAVGLTSVHVNRTLKGLDSEGLTKRNLRSVFIEDWESLAAAGDFDAHYLHADEEPLSA